MFSVIEHGPVIVQICLIIVNGGYDQGNGFVEDYIQRRVKVEARKLWD